MRLGEWDQQTNPDCEDGYCADPYVDVPVVERIPHENYQPTSKAQENDIALLRLERPVTFTNWIKPICLPISPNVRNHNHQDTTFTVAGWGKVSDTLFKIILSLFNLMYFFFLYSRLRYFYANQHIFNACNIYAKFVLYFSFQNGNQIDFSNDLISMVLARKCIS